ncbi:MAG: hypothetical protein C9356_10295 [Oleiphilus sp.]|nr:MAG: hypothetical protein C9356_10295 [Oleiphilus sp.]
MSKNLLSAVIAASLFSTSTMLAAQSPLEIKSIEKPVDLKTAKAVCGENAVTRVDGQFACTSCSEFTSAGDFDEPLVLRAMVSGHFSTRKHREVAVDTEGCEPHNNSYGGLILLREVDDKLQHHYYQPGFRLQECLKFSAPENRDTLVCNQVDYAQGQAFGQFSEFRFGRHQAAWTELQSWFIHEEEKLKVEPVSAKQIDINRDGLQDLRIIFKAKATREPELKFTLDFLFDGEHFKIAPTNKETKRSLDKLIDPYFGG